MKLSRWWDPIGIFQTKQSAPPPPGKADVSVADEGGVIGVLWGTKTIGTTYITYFGDIKTVAIKSSGGKK